MLNQSFAVYRGNIYKINSIMPKTDKISLIKTENGRDIAFSVPKSEIERAWLDIAVPWYGELKCDTVTEKGSAYFISRSVLCAESSSGKALADLLEKYGFVRIIYNAETDTAVYMREAAKSDPLLRFETAEKALDIMRFG